MSFVKWTPSLAVGVELIDSQHQELFRRIGTLMDAMNAGKGTAEVSGLLTFLEEYVLLHFRAEEEEMRRSAFPGYEAHRTEHVEFMHDLARLREEYNREGVSAHFAIKVNHRVGQWLVGHVMRSDRALAAHLKLQRPTSRAGSS